MCDFVSQHIRLGKVTGSLMSLRQIVEECRVNVDLLVTRAIKWSHRRLALSTRGLRCTAEHDQLRGDVIHALDLPGEDLAPNLLGIRQNNLAEFTVVIVQAFGPTGSLRTLLLHVVAARC